MNPIEQEGFDAAKAGKLLSDCPYSKHYANYWYWEMGWKKYNQEWLDGKI